MLGLKEPPMGKWGALMCPCPAEARAEALRPRPDTVCLCPVSVEAPSCDIVCRGPAGPWSLAGTDGPGGSCGHILVEGSLRRDARETLPPTKLLQKEIQGRITSGAGGCEGYESPGRFAGRPVRHEKRPGHVPLVFGSTGKTSGALSPCFLTLLTAFLLQACRNGPCRFPRSWSCAGV